MSDLKETLKEKFNPDKWIGWTAFRCYKYSGINLIDDVNELNPNLVIDVGCGHNRFKGHIKNLIGFDQEPFPYADLQMSIQEANFRKESADVALCLGSIQFGDLETVDKDLERVLSWVKPGGYIIMRVMQDHVKGMDYPGAHSHYIWDGDDIKYFTDKYNLSIYKEVQREEVRGRYRDVYRSSRLTWWWKKEGSLTKYSIDPLTCEIKQQDED